MRVHRFNSVQFQVQDSSFRLLLTLLLASLRIIAGD